MSLKSKIIKLRIELAKSPRKRAYLIKKYRNVSIGLQCEIHRNVSFGSEPYMIKIGNKVRISQGVNFFTHDGGAWVLRNMKIAEDADFFGKIEIGNNVHIGVNAVIMPNVTIGNNVIVGVGAIVTRNIPSNTVVAGIPAKKIQTIDEYYRKNKSRVEYTKHMNPEKKKFFLIEKYKLTKF